jgi:HrpA-like RNA helicase
MPCRLAAIGVAERVASERAEKCGDTIGYQIRLEQKRSRDTKLLFCTTGILLRTLEGDGDLLECVLFSIRICWRTFLHEELHGSDGFLAKWP